MEEVLTVDPPPRADEHQVGRLLDLVQFKHRYIIVHIQILAVHTYTYISSVTD